MKYFVGGIIATVASLVWFVIGLLFGIAIEEHHEEYHAENVKY